MITKSVISLVVVVLAVILGLQWKASVIIPMHLLQHTAVFKENLIDPKVAVDLRKLIKESAVFPSNSNDLLFYKTVHEHIGEAQPISPDGTCEHRFLVPSVNRTQCVLPGRVDVGRHWLRTGGFSGLKEEFESMVARILSFGQYNFDINASPIIANLFNEPEFQKAAKDICPPHQQVLDPFQYNFIIQIPGQTVAMHIDGAYFWGASRFQFPQWLLAVMVFSNLFPEQFIHQVQIVAYLHEWEDPSSGGEFIYWDTPDMIPKRVPPTPLAGSAIDGSKVIHAAEIYRADTKMPFLSKDKRNVLKFLGGETWGLFSGDEEVQKYHTNDLRVSIVYRARCFATEEDIKRYANQDTFMSLEHVLDTLRNDLVKRGRMTENQNISMIDFALKLLDEYVVYPYPTYPRTLIPLNYCMLPKVIPFLRHITQYIC